MLHNISQKNDTYVILSTKPRNIVRKKEHFIELYQKKSTTAVMEKCNFQGKQLLKPLFWFSLDLTGDFSHVGFYVPVTII